MPYSNENTSQSVENLIESASPLLGDASILPNKQAVVKFEQYLGIFEEACTDLGKFAMVGGAL